MSNYLPILSNKELDKYLLAIITTTYQLAGFRTATAQDHAFDVKELSLELQNKRYKALTESELIFLFRQGALGRYGDYKGANLRTYVSWIDSYLSSDEKKDFEARKKEYISKQIEQKNELSEYEKKKIIHDAMNREYHEYCSRKREHDKLTYQVQSLIGRVIPNLTDYMTKLYVEELVPLGIMKDGESLSSFFERCCDEGRERII